MTIIDQLLALDAKAKKADRYWTLMCETAEELGLLVPETVPYLPGHAQRITWRNNARS